MYLVTYQLTYKNVRGFKMRIRRNVASSRFSYSLVKFHYCFKQWFASSMLFYFENLHLKAFKI